MGFGKKLAKQWKNAAVISVYQGLGGKTVPRKYNHGGTQWLSPQKKKKGDI